MDQAVSTKAAAPLPSATPNGKAGRFDVDDILTELNETTPSAKETSVEGNEKGQEPKDVACKLFDTPSADTKAQGKAETVSSAAKKGKKGKKRDSVELPENFELRIGKKRGSAAAAATPSAAATADVSMEPDNEDDVGSSTMDVDATVVTTKPKANTRATKAAAKKEAAKPIDAAKKASASLAQVSSDALEALSAGTAPTKKVSLCNADVRLVNRANCVILVCDLSLQTPPSAKASAKRKRGQSPHESTSELLDTSVSETEEPVTAVKEIAHNPKTTTAATKSKKAKASATPSPSSAKSKKEESSSAAAKKPPTPKAAAAAAKKATKATAKSAADFVFLLTGSREESAVNESIIAALGGKASQTGRKFDHSSTHIICSELKRTEKFVAGCAGGKVSFSWSSW